jgi:peptide/nickel transport system permease protein
MAGAGKWKEKYRAYGKVFKQNWELFRASRIGLVGIAIMIFFIIIGVSAPYLNLRHPILWFAPDEDIIAVDRYHNIDTTLRPYNEEEIPVTQEIAFRVRPKSDDARTDRVYVTTDNRLYAVRPIDGRQSWLFPNRIEADSPITSQVVVVNYGDHTEPDKADFVIYFGTASGTLYALNDTNGPTGPVPAGPNMYTTALADGTPVASVATYSVDIEPGRVGNVRISQDSATDIDGLDSPFVVEGGFSTAARFRAYYSGNVSGKWEIVSAASDDGLKFNKREIPGATDNVRIAAGGPFDLEGAMDPFVFKGTDGKWYMYYVGFDGTDYRILSAESEKGMIWNKTGVVLSSTGPSDSAGMRGPWLVFQGDSAWTLFYAGYNGSAWSILSAETTTAGASWTPVPGSRVNDAQDPAVFGDPGNYAMLYTTNVSGVSRIYGATSSDLVSWGSSAERLREGETLGLVDTGGRFDPLTLEPLVATGVSRPSVLQLADGTFRLYYVALFDDPRRSEPVVRAVVSRTSTDGVSWTREHRDIYVATTEAGSVYAFSAVDNQLLWSTSVSNVTARVASTPLIPTNDPRYSQAFNNEGTILAVGSEDGTIHGLRTRDGGPAWAEPFYLGIEDGTRWTTPPVTGELTNVPVENGTLYTDVVYAASNDGWMYALFADTGTLIPEWEEVAKGKEKGNGIPIQYTSLELDGGELSEPLIVGETIYVGSSTGRAYALYRDKVGTTIFPGDVRWTFEDPALRGTNATMAVRPTSLSTLNLVFFVANHDNGTATNLSDDRSVIYSVRQDGTISWKQNFMGRISGPVIVWRSEEPVGRAQGQLQPAVWFGTDRGVVYAYSANGVVIAPLPPTWIKPVSSGNVYWLGTDSQGRDLFSQFMFGAQIALIVGFLSAFFSISIGVVIGLVAGYSGGRVESILMRFTDVILVLPGLPLVIILAAVLGANIWNIIFVISIVGWPGVARVIRSEVLSLKERPFIDSARVTGASNIRIMFRHVAPNILPLAFLYMTFAVSGAILTEAALSFLGLGDVTTPSWGQTLEPIQRQNVLGAWWWLLPPGLGITFLSLAFYLVGRGYEQIVNPRLRRRR